MKEQETIIGNSEYIKRRMAELKAKREGAWQPEPEEVQAIKPKHDLRLMGWALAVSLVLNIANCYGLYTERQERIERDGQISKYSDYLRQGISKQGETLNKVLNFLKEGEK